jgi:hypothetical protein
VYIPEIQHEHATIEEKCSSQEDFLLENKKEGVVFFHCRIETECEQNQPEWNCKGTHLQR